MDASQSDYKSPGSKSYSRSYNPGAGGIVQHSSGGGGGGDGPKGPDGPPAIINPPPPKDKSTELLTFDEYTGKPMSYTDVATANKFLNFVKTQGGYTMGEDPEADALYDAYKTATGRDTFMQDATVDSVTNMRTTETDGNLKQFMDRTSTITDNPTGKMTKSLVVDTPTSFTQRFITPTGIMENDVPQKFGAPQSLTVDPPKNIIGSELKDGGRVGFFMGGPALEGQALSIYNSMKDYGATDQAIADRLSSLGLYDPDASTPPGAGDNIIGSQINQGGGGGGGGITELQKTYTRETAPPQKFIGDPTAQLTGKGRLDPMGSGFDEILKSVTASNTNRVLTDDQLKQKAFFQDVYQEPQELSFFDKTKKTFGSLKDKFFQPKIKGTLGDRLQKQSESMMIPSLSSMFGKLRSPFNPDSPTYNPNLPAQLNFLEGSPMVTRTTGQFKDPKFANLPKSQLTEDMFMTTTGALIGRDPNTGALKYGPGSVLAGKNVISGFGTNDYEQALMDYITRMNANTRISKAGRDARLANAKAELAALTGRNVDDISIEDITTQSKIAKTNKISAGEAAGIMQAIADDNRATESRGRQELGSSYDEGTYCFDPNTLVQMADGSEKKIKEIQLGDQTKGGEVTGVFQFKASDEIHDYKGVTVAGSHYVKEDGKFIMVKDSPLSVKIDKIPVVYSLDTTGRRIFINDIEFADYNGDGVAKNFLTNAGVDLTGFDTEVLRQVEHRLI